jgi:adenylate kinase
MKNIILIGAPGSGKGTIAEILIKEYGYCHVSTGNLIRDEITAQTDIGKRMKSVIASGALVDADIIYSLVKTAVENARKKKCSVVFDGFPRTMEQVQ